MDKVMRRTAAWVLWSAMAGLSFAAWAGVKEVRQQIEGSMLVTGYTYIEPDGSVGRLELDQPEKLPPAVKTLVERAGTEWQFEPVMVDGVARRAKARMSLRVVAKKVSEDSYQIALRGAYFGEEAMTPDERIALEDESTIRPNHLKPPLYPAPAAQMGARGTVYVVLRIGRDGKVEDAIAEQINLQIVGREKQMDYMRNVLSKSALTAAKDWSFKPPTQGPMAAEPYWVVRVPVDYSMHGDKVPGYGEWDAYVPGPRQEVPWRTGELAPGETPDAMIAGGFYPVGRGLRLRTPLQSG
ncbi:energy transducer TonB [Pseudoxanthomonas mexicana]|uniref:energy transducer TonB n=1 Tax=Pseudoxanthomonas mexicana TaxID=128785 RepID=UPI000A6A9F69|nr:energy transducer TonB [Pseudoxanthomonas mexicana]